MAGGCLIALALSCIDFTQAARIAVHDDPIETLDSVAPPESFLQEGSSEGVLFGESLDSLDSIETSDSISGMQPLPFIQLVWHWTWDGSAHTRDIRRCLTDRTDSWHRSSVGEEPCLENDEKTETQFWEMLPHDGDTFRFKNVATQKCMYPKEASSWATIGYYSGGDGHPLQRIGSRECESSPVDLDLWKIQIRDSGNKIALESVQYPGMCMGARFTDKDELFMYECSAWRIVAGSEWMVLNSNCNRPWHCRIPPHQVIEQMR